MNIVALDTYTSDFDGLPFSALESLGKLQCYPRTSPEQVFERLRSAEAVLVNKVVLGAEHFSELHWLRYVGVMATGVNNVDVAAAKRVDIAVTNVAGYSTESVAQSVFAYLLHSRNKVAELSTAVHSGDWVRSPDFCFHVGPLSELRGKTLAIVGYGAIGRRVAEIAECFGMTVLAAAVPGRSYTEKRPSLTEALAQADFVSLHCPLTEHTERLVNAEFLASMKPEAELINTARGGLIDELALSEALAKGEIAHAYLDVLSSEPPSSENPLLTAKNCTITPHVAWATREARERLVHEVAENLAAFQRGERRNRVD